MDKNAKIYIAGHNGMVGSAIKRNLESKGYNNIVTRSFSELNLLSEKQVIDFFDAEQPEYVGGPFRIVQARAVATGPSRAATMPEAVMPRIPRRCAQICSIIITLRLPMVV